MYTCGLDSCVAKRLRQTMIEGSVSKKRSMSSSVRLAVSG